MKPKVVTLCGSTRFKDAFERAQFEETIAGRIVLTVGFAHHSNPEMKGNMSEPEWEETKERLDWLHFRKIDLSDEILVLNIGGYVGQSTGREIAYAYASCKPIRWLEPQSVHHDGKSHFDIWKDDPIFKRLVRIW